MVTQKSMIFVTIFESVFRGQGPNPLGPFLLGGGGMGSLRGQRAMPYGHWPLFLLGGY